MPELKSDHLKMIPDFSGEVQLLPDFITVCESLVNHFYNAADATDFQNLFLMNSIKAKIKGEAKLNLSSFSMGTWNDLKAALLNTYGDKRDCYTLAFEMCNLKQFGSETAFDFHQRIQNYINLHTSYLDTHNMGAQTDVKTYIGKLGLRTFLRGLREPLGSLMRTKNPGDLNEALNILTNDFQVDANSYSQTYKPTNQQQQQKKNNYSQFTPRTQYNNKPVQNQNNNQYSQQNKFFIPRQQTQQPQQQKYQQQQQQQIYRPPHYNQHQYQNVWSKPSGQPVPKPTPMSVSVQNNRSALNNIEINSDLNQLQPEQEYGEPSYNIPAEDAGPYEEDNPNSLEDQNFWQAASETSEHC